MIKKILIACRGETAIRLLSQFADANIPRVAVYTLDDSNSAHIRLAEEAHLYRRDIKGLR